MLKERNFRYLPRQIFSSYEQTSISTGSKPMTEWQNPYLHVKPCLKTAIPVPEQITLTVPTPPVPIALARQERNQDDNRNHSKGQVLRGPTTQANGRLDRTIHKPLLRAPFSGIEPDLHTLTPLGKDDRSELESLFKREHPYTICFRMQIECLVARIR